MKILEKLKEKGFVSPEIIEATMKQVSDERQALTVLLSQHAITPEQAAQVRAEALDLPLIELPRDFRIPEELFQIFSQESIATFKIVPIERKGDEIKVALVEPENAKVDSALDFIAVSHKVTIKRAVITLQDFEKAKEKMFKLEVEVKEALQRFEQEQQVKQGVAQEVTSQVELQRLTEQAPVTRIVDVALRYGVDAGASDVHMEPTRDQLRVRFRVDGKLKASLFLPKDILSAVVSRIKILARLRVDETRVPQDGRIHLMFGSRAIDFRVATFPTIEGEKVVLRILDPTKGITSLEELGMQLKSLDDVREFMKMPFGAMLISGPTGSGKSTTLYSVLKDLNQEKTNIVTLEDPVEYYLSGVNQSQVRPEINYDFASGLRQILRQDPNIIMVGEVRDNETATMLIHSALTGHLVFSTIHTNNAIGIIPRLLDMKIDSFLIPSALRLAVAQRLIPQLCNDCKKPYEAPEHLQDIVKKELLFLPKQVLEQINFSNTSWHGKLFKAKGCNYCGDSGIKGRLAVFESLHMTSELDKIIIEQPTDSSLKQEALRQGMITMRQDAFIKALAGRISIENAIASTTASYAESLVSDNSPSLM